jgi:hypothetical protein
MRHYRVLCVAGFMLLSGVVSAIAEPKSAVLAPVEYQRAVLEVHGADGPCAFYSPADLEKFPTMRLRPRRPVGMNWSFSTAFCCLMCWRDRI